MYIKIKNLIATLKTLGLLTFLFIIFTSLLYGAAGITGFEFLVMGMGARPSAMGSAFGAVADDINAIYWNPAGLYQLSNNQVSFMHSEGLANTKYEFLGFAYPIHQWRSTFAGSIVYLHHGKIPRRNMSGYQIGNFTASDRAITLSYGVELNDFFAFGVNLKLFQQKIDHLSANGFAFDFGLLHNTLIDNLTLGVNLQNIGPEVNFIKEKTPLPTKFIISAAYKLNNIILAADLNLPQKDELSWNIGTEYLVGNIFQPRIGLTSRKDLSTAPGVSFGFGLKYRSYGLDYAFMPFGELGDTHRITMNFRFGGKK